MVLILSLKALLSSSPQPTLLQGSKDLCPGVAQDGDARSLGWTSGGDGVNLGEDRWSHDDRNGRVCCAGGGDGN